MLFTVELFRPASDIRLNKWIIQTENMFSKVSCVASGPWRSGYTFNFHVQWPDDQLGWHWHLSC